MLYLQSVIINLNKIMSLDKKYFFIEVDPIFSIEEIEFLSNLEMLTCLWLCKNNPLTAFITNDSNNKLELLTVDHAGKNYKEEVDNFLFTNNIADELSLELSYDFPYLFLNSNIEKSYTNKFKVFYKNGTINNQIYKLNHLFHEDGILRKLLQHKFPSHKFNGIIVDEDSDKAFIIEEMLLFNAILNKDGYFSKTTENKEYIYDDILENISNFLLYKHLNVHIRDKKLIKVKKKI